MSDEDDHYDDLQEARMELIDEHQQAKATVNRLDKSESPVNYSAAYGRQEALIQAIGEIEDVLNDWIDRDDRDGGDGE